MQVSTMKMKKLLLKTYEHWYSRYPDGLMFRNIKNADQKVFTLAKELREVADQTIARTVQLSHSQGTTFTITNFGAADVVYVHQLLIIQKLLF